MCSQKHGMGNACYPYCRDSDGNPKGSVRGWREYGSEYGSEYDSEYDYEDDST